MSAKSKKVAVKSKQAKKVTAAKKKVSNVALNKSKAKSVELEVVPDMMPPEVQKHLTKVQDFVEKSAQMKDAELARIITAYSKQASGFAQEAVKSGSMALVYAWACGKLLNAAKFKLGHGAFGKWRKEYVESAGVGERTSIRYMKLAESCSDVRGLLQWAPTLRQAYVGCGVLPPPPERDKDETDGNLSEEEVHENEVQRKKEVLLESVSALQQRLHQGIGIKENLDASEIRQIRLARVQINSFFDQILGKKL